MTHAIDIASDGLPRGSAMRTLPMLVAGETVMVFGGGRSRILSGEATGRVLSG